MDLPWIILAAAWALCLGVLVLLLVIAPALCAMRGILEKIRDNQATVIKHLSEANSALKFASDSTDRGTLAHADTAAIGYERNWLMETRHALHSSAAAAGDPTLVSFREHLSAFTDDLTDGPYIAVYWADNCPEIGAEDSQQWIIAIGVNVRNSNESVWMKVDRAKSGTNSGYELYHSHASSSEIVAKACEIVSSCVAKKI